MQIIGDNFNRHDHTPEARQPHDQTDLSRPGVHGVYGSEYEHLLSQRSPIPNEFYERGALDVLIKMWCIRLCPGGMSEDVRKVLEQINCQLSAKNHMLLCIGSWLFQCNPSEPDWLAQCNSTESDWELYEFMFHERLEEDSYALFEHMQQRWNSITGESMTINDIIQLWRNMNVVPCPI